MRFKGKIIKSQAYYRFRQRVMIYGLIISAIAYPISFSLQALLNLSDVISIFFVILVYIVLFYFSRGDQKGMLQEITTKYIIVDTSKISIQTSGGKELESYMINDLDPGSLCIDVKPIDESSRGYFDELKGNTPRNHISFSSQGKEKRIDFMLDSHYGFNQLEKIKSALKLRDLSTSLSI